MKDQEIVGLWEAYQQVHSQPQELTEEAQIATEYFYQMGLNGSGIDILVEELGVDEFVEWVYDISDEYTLTEAVRSAKKRPAGGKTYKQEMDAINAREAAARERAAAKASKKQSETNSTPTETKRGIGARIANLIARGIERHNAANKSLNRNLSTMSAATAKTAGKVGDAASQFRDGFVKEEAYLIERSAKKRPAGGKTYEQEMDAINAREAVKAERAAARKAARTAAKPPKPLTPGERHEQEKAERAAKKAGSGYSQHMMTGSGGHGSVYQNPLAVRREEVENWVNTLVEEGYDLSEYTWDDMAEMYVSEAAKRIPKKVRGAKPSDAEQQDGRSRGGMRFSGNSTHGPASYVSRAFIDAPTPPGERPKNVQPLNQSEREEIAYRRANLKKEQTDLFDYILEYLVAEGYADTNENAIAIMSNMSEEWREDILDEAYQTPKFDRKAYLNKLSKRGGMGMGTQDDPHGYRDPKMAKVGDEFVKRNTAAAKAKKTGEPDTYRAGKEAQSKKS